MYSFDYKSSALPTELNWLFLERRAESDVFPNNDQVFYISDYAKPYAEICRGMQRYEPKVAPQVAPEEVGANPSKLSSKILKNLNKQCNKHLIICLTVDTVYTILTSVDGSKARHTHRYEKHNHR